MKWKFGRSKCSDTALEYPLFHQTDVPSPSARPRCIPTFPQQRPVELQIPDPILPEKATVPTEKAPVPPRYNPRWLFSRLTGLHPQGERASDRLDFQAIEELLKDDNRKCAERATAHEAIEAGEYRWTKGASE